MHNNSNFNKIKKIMRRLLSLAVISQTAICKPILQECVTKIREFAGLSGTGTKFDQTDAIVGNFDSYNQLVAFRVCVNSDGMLNSLMMAWTNPSTNENKVSASVGPSNTGTCSTIRIETPGSVLGVLSYYDGSRVTGVEFAIKGNKKSILLG